MLLQNANMCRTLELILLGRNPSPPGMYESFEQSDVYRINLCRVFSVKHIISNKQENKSTCSSAHYLLHQKVLSLTHASPRNKL